MDNKERRVFSSVTLGDLSQIRHYVRDTAVAQGCPAAVIDELIVAMNEALSNIVRHSYQNEPGAIKVNIICRQDAVKVILFDSGLSFNPTTVPDPDTTLPLEKRPFGGMGVHMMRAFCDELTYHRDESGSNVLTLLKQIDQ